MSKFFIAAGSLVIVILFTALIGPHFVDWTSYRESFEREATAYVGRPVTVAGKASVRLLPTPVLSFTDINVGDSAAPDLRMERFRAEVELAPLLRGEVRIIQMTMERPEFHFDLAALAGGRGALAGSWRLDPQRISLERLEIDAGSALVTDSRNGREWRAENLTAVVEADTLMGPGKAEAHFTLDEKPFNVTVGFGRFAEPGTLTTKLSINSPSYPVALLTDGQLQLPRDAPPSYSGTATVIGVEPGDAGTPRTHWADFRASGGFALQAQSLSLDAMQLSYGATERPLIMQASGTLDFADAPRFDLSLAARQIDLDRSLGGGAGDEPVAVEAAVTSLIDRLPGLAMPPIPGKLHFEAQGAVVGGAVIQAVVADLETEPNGWRVDGFGATLPGDTQIALAGALGIVPDVTFEGHAEIVARRPTALAGWWRGEVGSASRIGRFAIAADIDLRPDGQRLDNLTATTGAGTMTGRVDVKRDPQSGRAFVTVELGADRADLVETRALAELLAGKGVAAANVEQMTLTLNADVLSAGDVDAHDIVVNGSYAGGELKLGRLSVADLAGARIEARGNIRDPLGTPSGTIDGSVNAEDFSGAADFLASIAPESRIARHLRDVAPILSPVAADVKAEVGGEGDRLALTLNGSFGATHVTLDSEGKGELDDPSTISGWLKLHADGEDSGTVLRQFGIAALPVRSSPLNVDADFEGAVAEGGELKVAGRIAGIALSYDGATALRDGAPSIDGAFSAESADIDSALLLAGIAVPGVGEGHAASAAGKLQYTNGAFQLAIEKGEFGGEPLSGALSATFSPDTKLSGAFDLASVSVPVLAGFVVGQTPAIEDGGWSDAAFAAALPSDVALDVTLNAATLDLGAPISATDAKLALQYSAGKLQLDLASAVFAGGVLKGALAATIANGEVDMALSGGLQGAALEDVVWERSGLPIASGMLDASLDLVGRGRSTAGIVATLAGSGSFSVESGRVNSLNPEALTAVMAEAEGKNEPNETRARETFATLFGSGALEFGRAAGSFSVANGIMTIPTVSLESGATAILTDATFDLGRRTLQSQWAVRTGEVGADQAQPYVTIRFAGDVADPDRQTDLEPLLNLMRSRFLQRQLKELEALEEARKRFEAEQAARKAEEERRAAEEQAGQPEASPDAPADGAPEPQAEQLPDNLLSPEPSPISTDPPAIPQTIAPPIDLVPAPAPAPTPPASSQAAAPQPAPVPPAQPAEPPSPRYRTLPNGTIVKIR